MRKLHDGVEAGCLTQVLDRAEQDKGTCPAPRMHRTDRSGLNKEEEGNGGERLKLRKGESAQEKD